MQRSCRRQLEYGYEGFKDTDCIENIVEKGEIVQLFPQCFPESFFLQCDKMSICG